MAKASQVILRPYQHATLHAVEEWYGEHDGNACVVLPTGAGKSVIIAHFCKEQLHAHPHIRIVILTHVRELVQQNANQLRDAWPNAPLGVYAAGLNRRELYERITVASIQSIYDKTQFMASVDVLIIDECHLIPPSSGGMYRTTIDALREKNPRMVVLGFTATPFRMGQGLLTEGKDAMFDALIEPHGTTIPELIAAGFLAPLFSKATALKLDVSDVHKRGGEYVEAELQAAVDKDLNNEGVAREIVTIAELHSARAMLVFCAGVAHAEHMAEQITQHGIPAECVTGKTPKAQRDDILTRLRRGELRCVTNAMVLTVGFDYPDIDLIALVRPTLSKSLYHQMVGRGLRPKSHAERCIVLDFAGCVARHGPVTELDITAPRKGSGEAPTKECPACTAIIFTGYRTCPHCGHEFPAPAEDTTRRLHNDDIMGSTQDGAPVEMSVRDWRWYVHTSRSSGKTMLCVAYYDSTMSGGSVREYLTVLHDGFAGQRAQRTLLGIIADARATLPDCDTLEEAARELNKLPAPSRIVYKVENKFHRVMTREWDHDADAALVAARAATTAAASASTYYDDDIPF